jgi:hypothetical protein
LPITSASVIARSRAWRSAPSSGRVQHDLVRVAVAGGRRPRRAALPHPPEWIPGQQEHPQPRRDPRLGRRQPRPGDAQLEQRPLGLGHGGQRIVHLFVNAGQRIHVRHDDVYVVHRIECMLHA